MIIVRLYEGENAGRRWLCIVDVIYAFSATGRERTFNAQRFAASAQLHIYCGEAFRSVI